MKTLLLFTAAAVAVMLLGACANSASHDAPANRERSYDPMSQNYTTQPGPDPAKKGGSTVVR